MGSKDYITNKNSIVRASKKTVLCAQSNIVASPATIMELTGRVNHAFHNN